MTDMLVKLYDLPALPSAIDQQSSQGIIIRRALAPEKHLLAAWVRAEFEDYWASEVEVALCQQPVSCFIATHQGQPIGFACYDTTRRGFFGPTGVSATARGKGTGTALMLACMHDMWAQGYGYAIIGDAGPADYYARTVGAISIPGSKPGVYAGILRPSQGE